MKDHTKLIRTPIPQTAFREHSVPLFLTSSFTFHSAEQMQEVFAKREDGQIYSRYSNPNLDEFIEKMCLLEGTEAGFATASGMAAIFISMMSFLRTGDHVLASCALFGSTHQILNNLFPRFGISVTYLDPEDPTDWEAAVQPATRMMIAETPSNPGLKIIDLEYCGTFCREHDLLFIVDNCFATPVLQKPAEYGADLIVHSATKHIDGQGRVLGGIVLGNEERIAEVIFFARHTSPVMAPFNAWLLSKSLETLPLRMKAHSENALFLAEKLEAHPRIKKVNYPYLPGFARYELAKKQMKMGGGLITFELDGDKELVFRFINGLQLLSKTSNLGDTRSIITHPATTTHRSMDPTDRLRAGIPESLLRMSVGLEDKEDILEDILQSLDQL